MRRQNLMAIVAKQMKRVWAMMLRNKKAGNIGIFSFLFVLIGCGGRPVEVDLNQGNPIEVRDGNSLMRMHENTPVPFEEYIEYTPQGVIKSWNVGSPYGEILFGDYYLTIEDKSDDGDMDSLALSLVGSSQKDIVVQFFDKDSDKHPDMMSYAVLSKDAQKVNTVDFNMDGIFDFKDGSEGMKILLSGSWTGIDTINDFYNEDIPQASIGTQEERYTFRDTTWEKFKE
jgi:hypothetical protein